MILLQFEKWLIVSKWLQSYHCDKTWYKKFPQIVQTLLLKYAFTSGWHNDLIVVLKMANCKVAPILLMWLNLVPEVSLDCSNIFFLKCHNDFIAILKMANCIKTFSFVSLASLFGLFKRFRLILLGFSVPFGFQGLQIIISNHSFLINDQLHFLTSISKNSH